MNERTDIAIILVAAGAGQRARSGMESLPKQYCRVAGKSLIEHTIAALKAALPIASILPVIHPDHEGHFQDTAAINHTLSPVHGGATRQASVLAGLETLSANPPNFVLIHDAARPYVSKSVIKSVVTALQNGAQSVVPAIRPTDTLRHVQDGVSGDIADRDRLIACQTPQGFPFAAILKAHRAAEQAGLDHFTDDVAVMEWQGHRTTIVDGDAANTKVTLAEDLVIAEKLLGNVTTMDKSMEETRIGTGYDVHRLVDGKPLWLCGLEIPHSHGLSGHSDADVGLHALTDALLGAVGHGDIGQHFPPSDPEWKGASSDRFLAFAAEHIRAIGGRIINLDLTIIAEAPKIAPHTKAMAARIAEIAGITTSRVSVKATTNEQLGFAGRREGIAAMASASCAIPMCEKSDHG